MLLFFSESAESDTAADAPENELQNFNLADCIYGKYLWCPFRLFKHYCQSTCVKCTCTSNI